MQTAKEDVRVGGGYLTEVPKEGIILGIVPVYSRIDPPSIKMAILQHFITSPTPLFNYVIGIFIIVFVKDDFGAFLFVFSVYS